MDAWFFWKSLSVGLAVAAPVGPMGLLCIHRTLDRGQGAGLVVGAGVAAADLTFAAIAAFGVTAVSSALLAGTFWIKLVGSMLWWVILTTLISKSATVFRLPELTWINRISGAVLVAFAIYGFATLT